MEIMCVGDQTSVGMMCVGDQTSVGIIFVLVVLVVPSASNPTCVVLWLRGGWVKFCVLPWSSCLLENGGQTCWAIT